MANSDLGVINEELLSGSGVSIMVAKIIGDDLIITTCNEANAKMTGYTIEELVGSRPKDTTLSTATDMISLQKALDSAASGEPGIFSSQFKRKDGKPFAARCMVTGRFDSAGEITHYVFVATEINPGNPGLRWFGPQGLLVQAEQVGGTGAWRYDFETEELICSENCYALFGLSNSHDTLETLVSLIPHSEHVKLNKKVEECRKNGQTFEIDCTYYRYDGSRRDGLISAQPEFDSEGNIIAIIGVLRDETEVRALRRRQEMFLRAAKIGFIEIDLDGETVSYSADAGVIIGVGRTPGKIPLEVWKKRVHPEDYEGALKNYHDGIKSRKNFTRRYRFKVESGEYRWIEIRATTRPLPDTDIPAIFGTIADVHAEVIADQEITEIRTRLDLAVDSAGLGLWSWDLRSTDGDTMSWSPHMQQILGLQEDDKASWKTLESLIHSDDRAEITRKILANSEQKNSGKFKIEYRCIRPDGRLIWVENRGLARHDEHGNAIGIAGALQDITERKRAETDLKDSEQRFHDVASITEECIFETDAKGRIVYLSDAVRQIYGYEPKELIGKMPFGVTRDIGDDEEEWLSEIYHNGGWKDVEREILRKDGSQGWVTVNGRTIEDTVGNIIGFRGAVTDTTKRHTDMMQLMQSERRVNDVVRIAGGCIFDLDTEGNITYMSDNAKTLFGVAPEELIGKPTYLLAPDLKPRHQEWLAAMGQSESGLESEIRMTPLNGDPDRWMRTTCRTLTDDEGKLIGFRGIAFDVTARKQAALEILNAKKAAEAAAEERARFLSTMSHEIRTPLNAMIGMTDLLLDMPQSDEQKHLINSANTAGKHLLGLVNDILDFSKLDAGKLVVEQTPFDLHAETMAVQDMLANSAAEKGLNLTVKLDNDAKGQFIGDPSRIRQILVNLISNALKFTAKGEVSIHIHRAKNKRMRFSVTDTGTGIDKKVLPTLFSDFSQADSSITRKFGGTGLGLAICKRLTEVMGGEIGVSSTLAEGSTFWFEIPLQVEKASKSKPKEKSKTKARKTDKAWKLHILVAEDNPANQLLIKTLLTRMGHTLVITNDGSEAIEAALTESFDLVLMDVRMPKLDGVSATRLLREAGCHIPVIALTAHILADEKDRFSAAGMDDWLSKPFDARKLAETMFYWAKKGPQEHVLGEEKAG
ncbi:MAG: hypothetical protein COA84_09880 [Robiginitomaculum sp.]|nr:MAG: hypothetical protein COA84_09880 [Robiginitomaculum sp.]